MIRLILMRHGNTFEEGQIPVQVGAGTDLPLTAFGRLQADRIAQYLMAKGMIPKAIFAGGLKRQIESADLIGKRFGMPFKKSLALTEIDYGLWEGLTGEQIASKWPKEYAEWVHGAKWPHSIFQGTQEKHRAALEKWLEQLIQNYHNETVFGITSNGILRFFQNEKVKTGHFCELKLENGWPEVVSWNRAPL